MTDENKNEEKSNEAAEPQQGVDIPSPEVPPPTDKGSAVQRFNEEPFIVAVKGLLAKIDIEPKIGWEVEWQAVRRELKVLEESIR